MTDIATYVRIFDANPSDDLVTKRSAAVKELAGRYRKSRLVPQIFQTVNDIAAAIEVKGKVSEALGKEVEAAIRSAGADAFVADDQHRVEIIVCSLLGATQALQQSSPPAGDVTVQTVLAVGLWSALSFQSVLAEPKLEALRSELLEASRAFTLGAATSSRRRVQVPNVEVEEPETFDAAHLVTAVNEAMQVAVAALRTNAAMDREEIDLLWWVLGDWSDVLKERYSTMTNSVAGALSSGLEAGRMLRRMPGDAHRSLVLRNVTAASSLSPAELIKELGDNREKLAATFAANATVQACPAVFPLLSALAAGSVAHIKSKAKRSIAEWTERALLEQATLHVTSLLPTVTV